MSYRKRIEQGALDLLVQLSTLTIFKSLSQVLRLKGLAAKKLYTISHKANKKDFYSLYFLLEKYSLYDMMLYCENLHRTNLYHLCRSVSYFDDAEDTPEPKILINKVSWDQVKQTLLKEVRKILL